MIKEINEKIRLVMEELALVEILEKKFAEGGKELVNEESILQQLEIALQKENKDVEKLKKFTITNIVATLLKAKEEKLDKELQEYLVAKLKYDEQITKVMWLKESIKSIEGRISALSNSEKVYRELLDKKVEYIKGLGNQYNTEMMYGLEQEINKLVAEKVEITEAMRAGERLINEINAAEKALSSAESWGMWDVFGGDFISSMVKHDKLEEANAIIKRISNLLKGFNKELDDINLDNLQFSGLTITFDIFFDNIFTDIAVQNKITETFESIKTLNKKVKHIVIDLNLRKIDLEDSIDEKKKSLTIL